MNNTEKLIFDIFQGYKAAYRVTAMTKTGLDTKDINETIEALIAKGYLTKNKRGAVAVARAHRQTVSKLARLSDDLNNKYFNS